MQNLPPKTKTSEKYEVLLYSTKQDCYWKKGSRVKHFNLRHHLLFQHVISERTKSLSRILKLSKKTHKLDFNCTKSTGLPEYKALCLWQSLKSLSSLKSLDLKLDGLRPFSEREMESFCMALKNLASLQNLSLKAPQWAYQITDSGMKSLCQALKTLKSLKRLNLWITSPNVTDRGIKKLGKAIKALASLEDLSLTFGSCKQLRGPGIQDVCQALQILQSSFRRLSIHFGGSGFTDVGIEALCEAFNNLPHLEKLDLSLEGCSNLTEEGLHKLGPSFVNLTSLQDFSLKLRWCSGVTDYAIESLEQLGYADLKNLTKIQFDFSLCTEITADAFCQFFASLLALELLKSLDLSFARTQIDDEGIDLLTSVIEDSISLQDLSLGFGNTATTDSSLQQLAGALEKRPQLKYLSLSFGSSKITDLGMHIIAQALNTLTELEHITLDFYGCKETTDGGLRELGKALKNLGHLKTIKIVTCFLKTSHECKADMKLTLRSLASSPTVTVE